MDKEENIRREHVSKKTTTHKEVVCVCPACRQTVYRFRLHLNQHQDRAHRELMDRQRVLAEKLFDTDVCGKDRSVLREHGLLLGWDFVHSVWVDGHGEAAVAQRAQRLRCIKISSTLKEKKSHHTTERKQRMSEKQRGCVVWSSGLADWLQKRVRCVAEERVVADELERLQNLFAGRSTVVAGRGINKEE